MDKENFSLLKRLAGGDRLMVARWLVACERLPAVARWLAACERLPAVARWLAGGSVWRGVRLARGWLVAVACGAVYDWRAWWVAGS